MDVGRDQQTTQQAMDALQQVVRRFPDSRYATDARLKIDMTRDHLAGKAMNTRASDPRNWLTNCAPLTIYQQP